MVTIKEINKIRLSQNFENKTFTFIKAFNIIIYTIQQKKFLQFL